MPIRSSANYMLPTEKPVLVNPLLRLSAFA